MNVFKSIALASALVLPGAAFSETVKLDPAKTRIEWTGKKILVDSKHVGTVGVQSGEFEFKNGAPVGGQVTIDMQALVNEDLTDPKYNKKLVGHLKSNDFFSVDQHPTAKLVIKKVKKVNAGKYEFAGDLTIKGITKSVEFKGEAKPGDTNQIVADMTFDRTDYNVRYGSGKFFDNLGDKVIADEINIKATLIFQKNIRLSSR